MAVIKLNNDYKELQIKEQQEIEKVLASLSETAAGYLEFLSDDYRLLVDLDFIFARAMLAKEMKATRPVLNERGCIRIKDGRHPLLDLSEDSGTFHAHGTVRAPYPRLRTVGAGCI